MNGHAEVGAYWDKNRERQSGLQVDHHLVTAGEGWSSCAFYSRFYHKEKKVIQVVFGYMYFQFDEAGKIKRLSETYKKLAEENPKDPRPWALRLLQNGVKKLAIRRRLLGAKRIIGKSLSIAAFVLMPIAAVLYFAIQFMSFSDQIVINLAQFSRTTDVSNPEELAKYKVWLLELLGSFLAASTVYYVFADKIKAYFGQTASVRKHTLTELNKDAANLMANYLSGARSVAVFSGDFDFFEDEELLIDVFRDLESHGELSFYSERTREEVLSSVGRLPKTNELIHRLMQSGRMNFASNLKRARATYFEKDGVQSVLNRPNAKTFVVVSGIDENEVILKMFKGSLQRNELNGHRRQQR
ncbi:hypothetical protein QTO30_20040 [Yoonia sp. GPGPB17]|uniref:hypothetical protein n=1 Tax=Yoonia sp. GPGPB17 TaxID=3026147 RepID=UPI0030C6015B